MLKLWWQPEGESQNNLFANKIYPVLLSFISKKQICPSPIHIGNV